jgi:hypothetical protein
MKSGSHLCVSEEAVRQVEATFNQSPIKQFGVKLSVTDAKNDCVASSHGNL